MSNLKVSRVVEADRMAICELAQLAHEESLFADIAFSENKLFKAFDLTLNEPDTYLGLKVALDDDILGFAYALLGEFYIGEGTKVVTVITLATSPQYRQTIIGGKAAVRLTKGVEAWANSRKASYVLYHATSGTNPVIADRFFRKLGLTTLGGNYGIKLSASNTNTGIAGV